MASKVLLWIIEINIVGEKRGDGVGYYKNYTIFIAGAEDKVGSKVTVEIEEGTFK